MRASSPKQTVRAVVCETNPALRSGFQAALHQYGLREIEMCRDGASLLALLGSRTVDLVICAADLPGLDFHSLVQRIRHGSEICNPFVPMLATLPRSSEGEARRIGRTGVDGVAFKPLSMANMMSCVDDLASNRRPFVASDTYVGPSRRSIERLGQTGEQEAIGVPNTLGAKLHANIGDERLEELVRRGRDGIERLRLRNCCLALSRSVQRVSHHYRRADMPRLTSELAILSSMCEALNRRCVKNAFRALRDISDSVLMLAELLDRSHSRPSANTAIELMQKLAIIIALVVRSDTDMTEVVQSVVGGVRRFVATEWNGVYLQARNG